MWAMMLMAMFCTSASNFLPREARDLIPASISLPDMLAVNLIVAMTCSSMS